MTENVVADYDLARRCARAEEAFFLSWINYLGQQSGNPFGVFVKTFGQTTAAVVQALESPLFNRILCPKHGDTAHIADLVAFYRQHNMPCRVDTLPGHSTPQMLDLLDQAGLRHTKSHHTALFLPLLQDISFKPASERVCVRKAGEADIEIFADIFRRGFGAQWGHDSEDLTARIAESTRVLFGRSEWHLYLAFVDDRPASVGALFVDGDTASLASAATVPEMRRKGCQGALIRQRLDDAVKMGCTLAVTETAYGSSSCKNMQRLGLRIAYTKAIWEERVGENGV